MTGNNEDVINQTDVAVDIIMAISNRLNDMYGKLDESKVIGDVKIDNASTLLIISCSQGDSSWENCVYVADGKYEIYTRVEEVIRSLVKHTQSRKWTFSFEWLTKILTELISVGGIAGIIGLILISTICYAFLQNEDVKIPEFFVNSLTTIIGFYFGSKAVGK